MTDKFSHFFQKLSEPKIYIMDCWKSKAYYTCWLCGRKNLKVIRFHGKATWFTERNSFFFIEAKKTYRTSVVFRTMLKKLLSVFGLNCEFKWTLILFFWLKKNSKNGLWKQRFCFFFDGLRVRSDTSKKKNFEFKDHFSELFF